ncbi:uncharacterized protein DS421_4g109920 [Arachis hypogaea]|nr:uncharacterized protein DS421_4g109920 [Arachis hypogaea]
MTLSVLITLSLASNVVFSFIHIIVTPFLSKTLSQLEFVDLTILSRILEFNKLHSNNLFLWLHSRTISINVHPSAEVTN